MDKFFNYDRHGMQVFFFHGNLTVLICLKTSCISQSELFLIHRIMHLCIFLSFLTAHGCNNHMNESEFRVFNKGRQLAKLAGYFTWTHRLFHVFHREITSYFTATKHERPRFIHEKQKNLSWIQSNFSGNLCFLFCSNTLIFVPECRKCILRGPNFLKFSRGDSPPRISRLWRQ